MLSASGRSHEGGRFFLEPLVWDGTPVGVKPFVSWIEKDPLEKDSTYAARVAKLAIEHGVARGWRQLRKAKLRPNVVSQNYLQLLYEALSEPPTPE